ncbi:MAG: PIN domain-containing protein [Thermoplasmata archaeon]
MLLDTNGLFLPFTNGVPLESEVLRHVEHARIGVPSSVLGELARLVREGVPESSVALRFAARFPVVPCSGRGDAGILETARDLGAIVVTADRELQIRLRAVGVGVLRPRDRQRLELVLGRVGGAFSPRPSAATVKNRPSIVRRSRSR